MANTAGTGDGFSRDCNHGYQCHQLFTGDFQKKKKTKKTLFFLPFASGRSQCVVVDYYTVRASPTIH